MEPQMWPEIAHPDLQVSVKLVRQPLEIDGALSAKMKAIFMAAAAINGNFCTEAVVELRRARALGATIDEIMALPNVLLSSRGEGMAARAYEVVVAAVPELAAEILPSSHREVEMRHAITPDDALKILGASERGELILQARVMQHFVPDAMLGYAQGRHAAWNLNSIDSKFVHLMLVTINAAAYLPHYVLRHSDMARQEGAVDAELVEATLCAMPFGGVTSWFGAAEMLNLDIAI